MAKPNIDLEFDPTTTTLSKANRARKDKQHLDLSTLED